MHSEISQTENSHHPGALSKRALLALSFAALGVVYGDIGTSPLYAISEIFFGHGQVAVSSVSVFGAISMVLWALTLVVTVKYVIFVLRAEYEGEGGIFALLGLLKGMSARGIAFVSGLLVLAAGLLLGDGIITPAISVLSAIEGLSVKTATFAPYVVPITLGVLAALFLFQYKGTTKIGRVFGAVMCVWFAVLAALGLAQIIHHPAIFAAVNPVYALRFIMQIGIWKTMLILGAVVLTVTGGEALYADLGHFGVQPIRMSWLFLVYPALILNYLGQGAFLLSGAPVLAHNIFYSLVPPMLLVPMIFLATMATVIASQALISGAFSLAAQASAQGVSPRFKIVHTSHAHKGQIYVPLINWALCLGCMILVIVFRSSTNLASAYGLAETGVMLSTSIAMSAVAVHKWHWSRVKASLVFGGFLILDAAFLTSNSLKFFEGGYVPFTVGLVLFFIMMTWRWGRKHIYKAYDTFEAIRPLKWLIDLKERVIKGDGVLTDQVGRTVEFNRAAVFLSSNPIHSIDDPVPVVVRLYLKRKGALPKCVVLLNVAIDKEPYVDENACDMKDFGSEVYAVNARYGFMEEIDIRALLADLHAKGRIPYDISHSAIEVAEPEIIVDDGVGWRLAWQTRFYKFLYRFAIPAYRYFGLGADANLSTTLIPIHVTAEGTEVVRLSNEKLEI